MKDSGGIGIVAAVCTLCIFALLALTHLDAQHGEKDLQEKFNTYDIIVIDGNDYYTKDIIDYEFHSRAYQPDMIEVTFKNGDKFYFPNNDYGLKKEG